MLCWRRFQTHSSAKLLRVLAALISRRLRKDKKFASGSNGALNQVIGGWQTSGTLTLKEGFPLTITGSNNNNFGVGQHVNVVGDYHLAHPSRTEWFNTAAFATAPAWTLGNAPRYFSDLRDRKSTRLNSSHQIISYAVFCLKKKKKKIKTQN